VASVFKNATAAAAIGCATHPWGKPTWFSSRGSHSRLWRWGMLYGVQVDINSSGWKRCIFHGATSPPAVGCPGNTGRCRGGTAWRLQARSLACPYRQSAGRPEPSPPPRAEDELTLPSVSVTIFLRGARFCRAFEKWRRLCLFGKRIKDETWGI
jgi:hypothetical protein